MKTCLLVIDVQESFRQRPYFTEHDLPAYLAAQNALAAGCLAKNVPVVRIFHVDGPQIDSNPFAIESGHIKPLVELQDFTRLQRFTKVATAHW